MIQLKRFEQTARGRMRKIDRLVSLEPELDLTPFLAPPAVHAAANDELTASFSSVQETTPEQQSVRYRLVAVIEQSGGLIGGHYIAYILTTPTKEKVSGEHATSEDARSWMYCSDGSVRPSSWAELAQSQAYVVFYERIQEDNV
jgi:ubiquitin C-terminal hydrolase